MSLRRFSADGAPRGAASSCWRPTEQSTLVPPYPALGCSGTRYTTHSGLFLLFFASPHKPCLALPTRPAQMISPRGPTRPSTATANVPTLLTMFPPFRCHRPSSTCSFTNLRRAPTELLCGRSPSFCVPLREPGVLCRPNFYR